MGDGQTDERKDGRWRKWMGHTEGEEAAEGEAPARRKLPPQMDGWERIDRPTRATNSLTGTMRKERELACPCPANMQQKRGAFPCGKQKWSHGKKSASLSSRLTERECLTQGRAERGRGDFEQDRGTARGRRGFWVPSMDPSASDVERSGSKNRPSGEGPEIKNNDSGSEGAHRAGK